MPNNIEGGQGPDLERIRQMDEEHEHNMEEIEAEYGKVGKEVPTEWIDSYRQEELDVIQKAERYYGFNQGITLYGERSGATLSYVNQIRQHYAAGKDFWIGMYNVDNNKLKMSDEEMLRNIVVRLLLEKRPDYRASKQQIKNILSKLKKQHLKETYFDNKKKGVKTMIGKRILRDQVEEVIFEETGLEEFGEDRELKPLTRFIMRGAESWKPKEQDL